MKFRRRKNQSWSAIVCLLAFLWGAAGAVPDWCVLLASIDQTHTPRIGGASGSLVLVLSHSGSTARAPSAHQHGPVARVLCAFAAPQSTEPDHYLRFSHCDAGENLREETLLLGRTTANPALPTICPALELACLHAASLPAQRAEPPCPSALVLSIRSTVLLI